jgi:hypothetical protein
MAEVTGYKFGESAVMPQGKPFVLSIEGVDAQFELVHHLDSAGRIHMSVDRAGQASRRSMHDRRPPYVQHDIDDADAYDENGVIRDGHSVRVRLQEMRDNRNEPLIINTPFNLRREFHADGTPKYRRDDDPQPRRRRKVQQTDPTVEETADHRDHRPGFRDADRSASEKAYLEMVADQANAWRGPQTPQPETLVSDACPAGTDPREWARELNMRETRDAWRTPPVVLDANGPEVAPWSKTRAMETMPAGAYCKVGLRANEGDVITWNGAPAKLVRRGDWLFPEVIDVGPTRVGRQSGGAPPTRTDSMDAAQARVIRDQAYADYVKRVSEEWRTPP